MILILAWKWGLFELQAIANKGYAGWIGVIPSDIRCFPKAEIQIPFRPTDPG